MRWTAAGFLAVSLAASPAVAADPTQAPVPQPVSGAQMGQLTNYGRQVGENWLKENLGIDVGSLQADLGPSALGLKTLGAVGLGGLAGEDSGAAAGVSRAAASPTADQASAKSFSMHLTQSDKIQNLAKGVRDVPFGVEMNGSFQVLSTASVVHATLCIPFSPFDAWRAEANMPLDLSATAQSWWWRGLGLGKNLAFRSDLSSRLGFNEVEAGMGTDWTPGFWGLWDLDYNWRMTYGQGSGESSNWLKVSKHF